jgi:hypothetical protein
LRSACACAITAYAQLMSDEPPTPIRTARDLLASVPDDPMQAVEQLSRARDAVDEALDEAMARAALDGASFRSVASRAGLAPNSVAPRLARTAALRPYADPAGRVGSAGVERARYDAEQGRPAPTSAPEPAPEPRLRFRRRT